MHGHKSVVRDIMKDLLPPEERQQFKKLTNDISTEDFFKLLPTFFNDDEIKSALAKYLIEHIGELEQETGARIDAIINVYGSQYNYRSYNEVAGI